MATLTIRNVPDSVKKTLQVKAAQSGHSLEDTLRQMLLEQADQQAPASRIDAEEILRRASELSSDEPLDYRYLHYSHKELSDAMCGEFDDL